MMHGGLDINTSRGAGAPADSECPQPMRAMSTSRRRRPNRVLFAALTSGCPGIDACSAPSPDQRDMLIRDYKIGLDERVP